MNGISDKSYDKIDEIKKELTDIISELLEKATLEPGQILVIGCSSSEVCGKHIGTFSSKELGQAIFETAYTLLCKHGIYIACQCCEHLNRSLIVEKDCALKYNLEMVNVVPQLKAGGSFATAAYYGMTSPVAVEAIKAHAGIDIGNTLIGMHLRPVAVPVRVSHQTLGSAHVVCARTRLKFVGGIRAGYNTELE